MDLFSYLTQEDKDTLTDWIEINKQCSIKDLRQTLSCWDKNKKTMFKLLGKKLTYKVPIEIDMEKSIYYRYLNEIYVSPILCNYSEKPSLMSDPNNDFIKDFYNYVFTFLDTEEKESKGHFYYENNYRSSIFTCSIEACEEGTILGLNKLFSYNAIENGTLYYRFICTYKDKKPLTLPKGAKTIRSIQKILKYIEYPNMHLFEEWRNELSNLSTISKIKANLVLSIAPIDFLTLSDNTCGWRSCVAMNHDDPGEFHSALTEMLNSNCTIVAYLESNHKKFTFNYHEMPNKSWRQIFYCHKDIICAGKSYPYTNDKVTKAVLEILQNLAKENLGWEYTFGPQPYKDNIHNHDEIDVRYYHSRYNDKYKIILYTLGYYNDFIADHSTTYWCVRNKPKHTKMICVSGPATCFCCGQPLVDCSFELLKEVGHDDLADWYEKGICSTCYTHRCKCCQRIDSQQELYKIPNCMEWDCVVCKDCLKEYIFFDKIEYSRNNYTDSYEDSAIHKDQLINLKKMNTVILIEKKDINYDNYKIKK